MKERGRTLRAALAATAVLLSAGTATGQDTPPAGNTAVTGRFKMVPGPLLLSRTLRRALPDGQEFTVTRRYRIVFTPDGDGYRVDGALAGVDVRAPQTLSAFADLERTRPDTGMFPLHLDAAGMLLPSAGVASGEEVRKAAELVLERMGHDRLPALDMLEAQSFVQRIRQRPPSSQWPVDIFRPRSDKLDQSSEVPLPGGAVGRITIAIAARSDARTGLMRELNRTIMTDLAGDRRYSYEIWTLEPIAR